MLFPPNMSGVSLEQGESVQGRSHFCEVNVLQSTEA